MTVTPPADTAPAAPDAPEATPRSPLTVAWGWELPDDGGDEITRFDLQWRIAGDAWSGNVINAGLSTLAEHTIPNVQDGVEARARAVNSVGNGAWSATAASTRTI